MATVRVHSPTCNAELEIDDRHLGQEVECGSCLQTFVAEEGKKKPYKMRREDRDDEEADRPRRRRRSRRDDEDDYDYSPPRRSGGGGGNALGVVSLILGILSLPMACCCGLFSLPISVGATVTGAIGLKNPQGKGMAAAGLILGLVSLALFVVALVVGVGLNMANFNQFNRRR